MTKFVPSTQQRAFMDALTGSSQNINLIARAGCGKSTTAVQAVQLYGEIFPDHEVALCAFNKKIADELSTKLAEVGVQGRNVRAATMHSLGFSAWRRVAKGVRVDGNKVRDIVRALADECSTKAIRSPDPDKVATLRAKAALANDCGAVVCKIVSLAKQNAVGFLCGARDDAAWFHIVDHFAIGDDLPEDVGVGQVVALAQCVYERSLRLDREVVDFDDMILAPLVHGARFWPKDLIIIDEAQDTNPARRALAKAMLRPRTGRLVAIGDPAQAIYGFTGADADSMNLIRDEMASVELPLTRTYRCGKAIVAFANQWVPDLVAADSNGEGVVRQIPDTGLMDEGLGAGDAILCRNNKPLLSLAYRLIRAGIGAKVEGREIGEGLVKLARRWGRVKTTEGLRTKLEEFQEREVAKAQAKDQAAKAQAVEDKVGCLLLVCERCEEQGRGRVEDVVAELEGLFGDNVTGVVTLCSGHKSKGREWRRVFWLDREGTIPSKYARRPWQLEQEANLAYVIATRAMDELVEVVATGVE